MVPESNDTVNYVSMAVFVIQGGRTLRGEVEIHGAKNHALKVFPSSLLFREPIVVRNTPLIEDVFRSHNLLRDLGFSVENISKRTFRVTPPRAIANHALKSSDAERFRASILFVGPLLLRTGKVFFPHPGGCVIGKRPIDLFLDGWRAMGAHVRAVQAGYTLAARSLKGVMYTFRKVSHTATESLMMTAVLARGRTVLKNAASEPEVEALAKFLNASGAEITGAGTPTITIQGHNGKLLQRGECTIIPDRIDAGGMAILATLLGNSILIKNCDPAHMDVLLTHLEAVGAHIERGKDWLRVSRPSRLLPVDIKTREYPGFVTDYQALFTVLLTQAKGQAQLFETIFEGRLSYVEDLNRMGANITICDPHRAIVFGKTPLYGREMQSPDIRAGLAFVIAALVAKGESRIGNIYQIDRGYEHIDETLRALGADIQRV